MGVLKLRQFLLDSSSVGHAPFNEWSLLAEENRNSRKSFYAHFRENRVQRRTFGWLPADVFGKPSEMWLGWVDAIPWFYLANVSRCDWEVLRRLLSAWVRIADRSAKIGIMELISEWDGMNVVPEPKAIWLDHFWTIHRKRVANRSYFPR